MPLAGLDIVIINRAVDEIADGRRPTNAIYDGTIVAEVIGQNPEATTQIFDTAMQLVPRVGAEKAKLALYLAMMANTEDPELAPFIMSASDAIANEDSLDFFKTMVWHRLSEEAREQINNIGGGGSWAGPEDI